MSGSVPRRVDVAGAASFLFVPGDRPERFDKAAASGADVIVCDLEDAVADADKVAARGEVARWLDGSGSACVRVNAAATPQLRSDLTALAGRPGLTAVMIAKAEDPADLAAASLALGPEVAVIALVETALGLSRAAELAGVAAVIRLAFGSVDFALDIGARHEPIALLSARTTLVLASRLAGVARPIDGVTVNLDDPPAVGVDASAAAALGFTGKLCIHPSQVAAVNAAFRPNADEIRHAERVLAAAGSAGVARLDGEMIDRPVLERARRTLARAGIDSTGTDRKR